MTFLKHKIFIDIKEYNYTFFDLLDVSDNLIKNCTELCYLQIAYDDVKYIKVMSKISGHLNEWLSAKLTRGYRLNNISLNLQFNNEKKGPTIQIYDNTNDQQAFGELVLENAKSLADIDYKGKQQYFLVICMMRVFALNNHLKFVISEPSLVNIRNGSNLEFLITLIKN